MSKTSKHYGLKEYGNFPPPIPPLVLEIRKLIVRAQHRFQRRSHGLRLASAGSGWFWHDADTSAEQARVRKCHFKSR